MRGGVAAAIVLAGRKNTGRLRAAAPEVAWEALIPLAGRPMAGYVVAALGAVREVRQLIVAGPTELAQGAVRQVDPGADLADTLRRAAALLPAEEEEVLLAAGDAPLLTAAALADLLAACRRRGLAFGYPIVSRARCEAQFPGVRRTYVRLREGAFTGGNCFYLRREALPAAMGFMERIYTARKRPLRLAALLGWGTVLHLLTGTLRLRDAERVGARLLGWPAAAVVMDDAGIGVDVDSPEDLELCRAVLEGRRSPLPGGAPSSGSRGRGRGM